MKNESVKQNILALSFLVVLYPSFIIGKYLSSIVINYELYNFYDGWPLILYSCFTFILITVAALYVSMTFLIFIGKCLLSGFPLPYDRSYEFKIMRNNLIVLCFIAIHLSFFQHLNIYFISTDYLYGFNI